MANETYEVEVAKAQAFAAELKRKIEADPELMQRIIEDSTARLNPNPDGACKSCDGAVVREVTSLFRGRYQFRVACSNQDCRRYCPTNPEQYPINQESFRRFREMMHQRYTI